MPWRSTRQEVGLLRKVPPLRPCTYIHVYIHICTYIYICTLTCMYIYMYIQIYIELFRASIFNRSKAVSNYWVFLECFSDRAIVHVGCPQTRGPGWGPMEHTNCQIIVWSLLGRCLDGCSVNRCCAHILIMSTVPFTSNVPRPQMASTYVGNHLGQPRGSRFLIIEKLELKDHDYSGFWGLRP